MTNHFFTLLLAASCWTAVGQVPDYVPTDGLVGWFDMEGELLNELSGELGTLTNTSNTSDRYGNEGMAIEFLGNAFGVTSGSNMPTGALSVASWILPQTSWSQGAGIEFLCLGTSGSTKWGAIVGSEFAHLNRGRGCQGSGVELQNPGIELNQWNHVVFSCAGPGLATEVYLNGSMIGLSQNINAGSGCSASNLYFGVDIFSQPEYITGALDDIGIWNRAITEEEVLALYNSIAPIAGCTDEDACNFNVEAILDDGSCVSCDIVSSFCGPGTIWAAEMEMCIGDGSGDINLDGCVQLNDLLDLLSAFGDCGAEEAPWQCGDPLEYQGYDYETVQIGEQCWFAENLRAENYTNGDLIPSNLDDSQWSTTNSGAVAVYGEDEGCASWSPSISDCNPEESLSVYGRLYNWYAVDDNRGLCPGGWHVPTDAQWIEMEITLGMSVSAANSEDWRGTNQGSQLKSTWGWYEGGNGTNSIGFSGMPGGNRSVTGDFQSAGRGGDWWTSSTTGGLSWDRDLNFDQEGIGRQKNSRRHGFSIRCIQDAE